MRQVGVAIVGVACLQITPLSAIPAIADVFMATDRKNPRVINLRLAVG